MSSDGQPGAEERIIALSLRDAISWLNETPDQFGSFWEFAKVAPIVQDNRLTPTMPSESVEAVHANANRIRNLHLQAKG